MKELPPYQTIYFDDDIVLLNKKAGLNVAADRYDENAPRLDLIAEKEFGRLFAVHRIDKDTSGIIIYTRNAQAHKTLCKQFENRTVEKTYHALIYGKPTWETFACKIPLQIDGDARHRTVVSQKFGKPAETDFSVISSCSLYSWIEAKPKTGRTHQIRVHLKELGHCIVCDGLYGGNQKPLKLSDIKRKWHGDEYEERPLLNRLALHAYKISFLHPKTNEKLEFVAPYPKDLEAVRHQLYKIFKIDSLNLLGHTDSNL